MRTLTPWICALSLVAACADEDSDSPPVDQPPPSSSETTARDFTLKIENVAPWRVVKLSSQRFRVSGGDGNLGPGDAYEIRFTAGAGHALSFMAMLRESNDWFFAPDPAGIPLYENGAPVTGDVTDRIQLWNAGTEADQEPGVGNATGIRQRDRNVGEADADAEVRLVPDQTALATGTMFTRPAVNSMIRATLSTDAYQMFTLRIENISTSTTLVTSRGTRAITLSPVVWVLQREPDGLFAAGAPLPANGLERLVEAGEPDPVLDAMRYERGLASPLGAGVFVIHRGDAPLFTVGTVDRGLGLEALAEDGEPASLVTALDSDASVVEVGTLETADGPARQGEAFEQTFRAEPGDRLSFATNFGASNDWFFASDPAGIELFLGDDPRWGDVTASAHLYDAGTEGDDELDIGVDTASQQAAPNTGRDDVVPEVRAVTPQRYDVAVTSHIRVTLTPAPAAE